MSCLLEITEHKVGRSLLKRFGSNVTKAEDVWASAIEGNELSPEFVKFIKDLHPRIKNVTLDSSDANRLIKDMLAWYQQQHPDGNNTVLDIEDDNSASYGGAANRSFAISRTAEEINAIVSNIIYNTHNYKSLKRKELEDWAIVSMFSRMNKRRPEGKGFSAKKYKTMSTEQLIAFLDSVESKLGDNITEQDKVLLAACREMIYNRQGYFNEVFQSNVLAEVSKQFNKDEADPSDEDKKAINSNAVEAGQVIDLDSFFDDSEDYSFRAFESHSGQYATFTMHISSSINAKLSSIRKCKSTTKIDDKYDYDTNNCIGIAECFTPQEIASLLYTRNYNNIEDFIESVKLAAEQTPGYEGLIQLYDYLKENKDFASECYLTFAKFVVGKKEVYRDETGIKVRLTNNAASKSDALSMEYFNNIKSTCNRLDGNFIRDLHQDASEAYDKLKRWGYTSGDLDAEAMLRDCAAIVHKGLSLIFPSITEYEVLNYILRNKNDVGAINTLTNLKHLIDKLDACRDTASKLQIAYNENFEKLSAADRHNTKLKNKALSGYYIDPSEYVDINTLLAFDPASVVSMADVLNLAKDLTPYASVKIELNSRNAMGNLSSDVLNNSMISNLKAILSSELNSTNSETTPIKQYAAYKFRSKQYEFSSILIEHRNEDGTLINAGLFRKEGTVYVPTEYFDKLIEFSLFNGISDTTTGKNALYSDCTMNDYFATAFEAYLKSTVRVGREPKTKVGNSNYTIPTSTYFMRTPSDAPKNYFFTAPRYKTSDIRRYADEATHNAAVDAKIKEIPRLSVAQANAIINSEPRTESQINAALFDLTGTKVDPVIDIDKNTALNALTGKKVTITVDNIHKAKVDNNKQATIAVSYEGLILYIQGNLDTRGATNTLKEGKLLGVKSDSSNIEDIYKSDILANLRTRFSNSLTKEAELLKLTDKDAWANHSSRRIINRDSAIFKQLQMQFRQEMQDVASAVESLFVKDANGRIRFDNDGQPILKPSKSGIDRKKTLYQHYHWNGKQLVDTSIPGKAKLTGKVFTSDKFTVFKDGKSINYFDAILSDDIVMSQEEVDATGSQKYGVVENPRTINILYGRASGLNTDSNGIVEFTPAQQEAIDEALENFLTDYISTTLNRASNYSEILENIEGYSQDNVIDFILNYRLAYYSCNDLFEGNAKFYKNTQDFLKRAKEVQAGGVPYAITDITKSMTGKRRVELRDSYINSDPVQKKLTEFGLSVKGYTTFNAVTVNNSEITNERTIGVFKRDKKGRPIGFKTIGTLSQHLINNLIKHSNDIISEKEATQKAFEIMKGYDQINTNDAQSYITFEEWIRRIAGRGQLAKYMPLIERIQDRSKPLSAKDLETFVQVQKNFYYDMQYDEEVDVMAPRQIKNAEFVLIPRLIEGTELEEVYKAMKDADIDQLNTLATSKAGKSKVLDLWDNNGNLTQKTLNNFKQEAKIASEVYDYNYLYTQQETPQHMSDKSENKFGLQISKKVLDNIPENSPLYPVKQSLWNALCANIKSSFEGLMSDLNITIKDNAIVFSINPDTGNREIEGLDKVAILEKFKQELIRTGITSNLSDFVTTTETPNGVETIMPFYINSFSSKMESIAQSIFNRNITRQKLPGFHAAQISRIGFKDFIKDNPNSFYPDELRFREDKNGKLAGTIDVLLPYSAFGLDPNQERFKGKSKKEIDEILIKELQEAGKDRTIADIKGHSLNKCIGYRIPTEAKMSSQVMNVVGFLPNEYGSTIVVPDAWVAVTGSDFDIDSVYGIQYRTYVGKDGRRHKIEMKTDDVELYCDYVISNLDKDVRKKLYNDARLEDEDFDELREEVGEVDKKTFNRLAKEKYTALLFDLSKTFAKSHNLKSFDDFAKMNIYEKNSKDANANHIVDCIINILESSESLEETLSQSNFRDIIDARDKLLGESSTVKLQRESRSCYDFFDQAEGFEDASMGMALKGFSVSADTFTSVCNSVRPVLANPISVVYNFDNLSKNEFKNKVKELQKRFGEDNVKANGKNIIVNHAYFGWSNNGNKNVVGSLITAYSAQTTAHILDAIKEGAIPNVTIDTFGVYKLFPSLGIDYDTCIGFMMQPAISKLVKNINATKSVFINSYDQPLNLTLFDLSDKLKTVLGVSNEDLEHIIQDYIESNNVLDYSKLSKRFNGTLTSSPVEELLFDYAVISKYKELNNLANKVTKLTMVCNPDKFGAKQSIYATTKVFDDIRDILIDSEKLFEGDFLEEIYPGISEILVNGLDGFLESNKTGSKYPPLHYYLKYATGTSVKINSLLFDTHKPAFEANIRAIKNVFSNERTSLSEDLYNSFSKYLLNYVYNQSNIIALPVEYDKIQGIVNVESTIENPNGDNYVERKRIYGYGRRSDTSYRNEQGNIVPFTCVNPSNPTSEEIKNFALLSPAQKVFYIKETFDNPLVCKYITPQTQHSVGSRVGSQTVRYKEEGVNIETIYEEFRKTYENSNPLLVLTAMDLIKYAVVVEGLNIQQGGISKVISNKSLYQDGLRGCGFIDSIKRFMNDFTSTIDSNKADELAQKYVRSHPEMAEISHRYINLSDKTNRGKINITKLGVGIINLNDLDTKMWAVKNKFGRFVFNKRTNSQEFIPSRFIQVNYGTDKGKVLYQIRYNQDSGYIYIYPLNLLNVNESSILSVKDSNNIYMPEDFYETVLADYIEGDVPYDESLAVILNETEVSVNNYGKEIKPNEAGTVFVFGSNPIGINGRLDAYGPGKDSGGSAAFAQRYYGVENNEIMDNTLSKNGKAYGLTTVTAPGKKKSLTREQIIENIKQLYKTAKENSNKRFKVAYTNTTETSLNGYTGTEMMDMFIEAAKETGIPNNIWFSDNWVKSGKFNNDLSAIADARQQLKDSRTGAVFYSQNRQFNINDEKFEKLRRDIIEHFDGTNEHTLYVRNLPLEEYLVEHATRNAAGDLIDKGQTVSLNGRKFRIYKPNTTAVSQNNKRYSIFRQYLADDSARQKPVATIHSMYEHLIADARAEKVHTMTPFAVVPVKEDGKIDLDNVRHSSVTEKIAPKLSKAHKDIARKARQGDEDAQRFIRQVNTKDIRSNETSVKNNMTEVVISTAEYVVTAIDGILDGEGSLNYFTQDPETGVRVNIVHPASLALIKRDPAMRRKFLQNILEANHLIEMYSSFSQFKYDNDDETMKYYIEKISEAVNRLKDSNLFKAAEEMYVNDYLTSISTNPNIKNNIHSLYDGFFTTSYLTSMFNDLEETGNPMLQIITSNVMSDIRAKELQGDARVNEFKNKIKELNEEARKHGNSIDWKHIISDNGKWIDEFNDKFVKDLEKKYNAQQEAYSKFKEIQNIPENILIRAEAFNKYLKARRAYNIWKLKNVHQELTEEYYEDTLNLEATMLKDNGEDFKEIYVEYSMLNDELKDILEHAKTGPLDDYWENKRINVLNRLTELRSSAIKTPLGYDVKHYLHSLTPSDDPIVKRNQIITSLNSAEDLEKFHKSRTKINDKYFDYNEKFGFRELVDKNLAIVRKYEVRDSVTGKMIYSESELRSHPEYVKAKNWLYNNTIHKYAYQEEAKNLTTHEAKAILLDEFNNSVSEHDINIRIGAAITYFSTISGSRSNKNAIYKLIAKNENAYDEYGILDARKLSLEQLKAIKNEQRIRYGYGEDNEYSEKRIMSTSTTDNTVYTKKFWEGLKVHGLSNDAYGKVCKEVNDILRTILDPSTGVLNTSELTTDQIKEILKRFALLGYNPVDRTFDNKNGLSKYTNVDGEEVKKVKEFIEKNVEFGLTPEDQARFDEEVRKAKDKGIPYYLLWSKMNYELSEDGTTFAPNHLLWGYVKPKSTLSEEERNEFIDHHKTAAIKILKEAFTERPNKYYEQALHDELVKLNTAERDYGKTSLEYAEAERLYNEWFDANHIYNPNTHTIEPLVCWTMSEPTIDSGEYEPSFSMTDKVGKDKYRNRKYKANIGTQYNFKNKNDREEITNRRTGYDIDNMLNLAKNDWIPSNDYDNNSVILNKQEADLKEYIQGVLSSLATTSKAKQYFQKGYLPSKAKDEEITGTAWLKEIAKGFGYIENKHGSNRWHRNLSYDTDTVPDMPMLHQLTDKNSISKPRYEDYIDKLNGKELYQKALEEYEKNKKNIEQKNEEIHKALLDNDWETVISEFIKKAAHYNAIQDNKYNLYFAQELLNKMLCYHSDLGDLGKLSVAEINDDDIIYDKIRDKNLQEQYNVWLHRLIYDEYKKPQGKKTKFANLAQSVTSNMYMTLNLRGGIANVTVGEANILGEAFAKEYFGTKDWALGKQIYFGGSWSYISNAYSDKATTLQDAIIKAFAVVDYDEFRGLINTMNAAVAAQKLRDAMYCCQTAGEHFMQNSAMFAMMLSHRLIKNPDYDPNTTTGEPEYLLMNEEEYLRSADMQALKDICTEDEYNRYKEFIDKIHANPNVNKKYSIYRRNAVSDFLIKNLKDKAKAYQTRRNKLRENLSKKFKTCDNLYSQFELKDGKMAFKQNSILDKMHTKTSNKEVSDAYAMLGKFKQRVISVNKKIHGNYGKLDAAQIESQWFGGLVMQYHKHIVPGFMKRWRTKGYYNESRGTVEKGSYISLYDFLATPIKQIAEQSELSTEEVDNMTAIQNVLADITSYRQYLALNWQTMPEYEKANIKRAMIDMAGMALAICLATLCRLGWDDDDDSLAYNLMLYEADRLYSEINMWNPVGAVNEVKTLYSTPLAAQSWITDGLKILDNIAGVLLDGDDYDPYFRSGRYAGEYKLKVYVERRIPYYRQYAALRDIGDNNRYYKRTTSLIDTLPKKAASFIKD